MLGIAFGLVNPSFPTCARPAGLTRKGMLPNLLPWRFGGSLVNVVKWSFPTGGALNFNKVTDRTSVQSPDLR